LTLFKFNIRRLDTTSSTNDEVIRMAEGGAPEGTVVVARRQTLGRGRLGRRWESPTGAGLYLSVLLRPQICPSNLWQIGFVASLAAASSIRRAFNLDARIKWPNDILIEGRKVCGILIESTVADTPASPVVVGIGINVNTRAFPEELAEKATSLLLQSGGGQDIDLNLAESALLDSIREWYVRYLTEGFPPVLHAWRLLDCTSGHTVRVLLGGDAVEGRAVEVDLDGNLIVEQDGSQRVAVSAGEVILGHTKRSDGE